MYVVLFYGFGDDCRVNLRIIFVKGFD